MSLDVLLLAVVLTFTIVGYITGILRQILKVTCVILSFFLSGPAAKFLTAHFATAEHIGPLSSYGVVRILAWVGIYVLLRIVAFYINRAVGADTKGVLQPINRRLGGYLGFVEGVGLSLVVLWSLQIWINDEDTIILPKWRGKAADAFFTSWSQGSVAWRLASRYNPLVDYGFVPNMKVLLKAAKTPQVLDALKKNANVQALLNHPKVKALTEDETLRKDLADRDYMAVLTNRNFKAMMSDREVQNLMRNVHVFEILKGELAKSEQAQPAKKTGSAPPKPPPSAQGKARRQADPPRGPTTPPAPQKKSSK